MLDLQDAVDKRVTERHAEVVAAALEAMASKDTTPSASPTQGKCGVQLWVELREKLMRWPRENLLDYYAAYRQFTNAGREMGAAACYACDACERHGYLKRPSTAQRRDENGRFIRTADR